MRYITRAGVEVKAENISVGNEVIYVATHDTNNTHYNFSMFEEEFKKFFEPIPSAPDDTVEVKREDLAFVVRVAEGYQGRGFEDGDGTMRRIRAALGEKGECEHPRDKQTHDGLLCCCGATRSLSDWSKPEKTE